MKRILLPLLTAAVLLSACQKQTAVPPTPPSATPVAVVETPTVPIPSATPEAMAAVVNGEGIPLKAFDAELARLQAALSAQGVTQTPEELRKAVLDELVGQTLLAQAAREGGFTLDEAALQDRITALANQMGGMDALTQWQSAHGYTPEDFQTSLARAIASEWQSAKIYSEVPLTAEQVHARQILVFDEASANTALSRLNAGTEFATQAYKYDAVTGGDLGWFPRGYLTAPEVEDAAFALEPGQVSGIIKSSVGYHIILVMEKEAQRPLSPEALQTLQEKALETWLARQIAASQVQVITP